MTLANAFNSLLFMHSRPATIERPASITAKNIKISPSNFFRNLQGPEEIVMEGREFVISKNVLDEAGYPVPKRGDRIKDQDLQINTIREVREMFDFGGAIIGYRVRCE